MTQSRPAISRTVIIDDDRSAIDRLTEMLSPYVDIEVVGTAANIASGMECIRKVTPDLVFLDIDFPDGNGIDMMKWIRSLPHVPYVVMYTAYYDEYSRPHRVFQNGECDYLLKPIDVLELDKTIQRFRHCAGGNTPVASLHSLPKHEDGRSIIVLMSATSEMRVLRISDIGYFRYNSVRKLWEVVLNDRTVFSLRKSSSANDILHLSDRFIQTHQSYIVNLDYVLLLSSKSVTLFPPFDTQELPTGRTYFKSLQKHFMSL